MAKYHDGAVSGSRRVVNVLLTVLLAALCVVWLYPVLLILINSLKDELAISTATVFELPTRRRSPGCTTIPTASPSSTSCNPSAIRRRSRSPRSY